MTTAYTSLLGLALPVTGELQGTWGDTVNNSITSLLDTAVAGTTTLNTDSDVTLSTTTGAANQARQAIILWTANGTTTRNITAPAQSKIYTVINASAGTQSIVFRGVGPTTGVTIVKGESALVAWNGSDFIKISNTSGTGSFTNLTATGAVTFSTATDNIALGTSQTSGTWTAGGSAQTGTLTLDQSTKAHTLNIGAGATENATTKTINLGTAGVSGSTTAINIGSAVSGATNTITINGNPTYSAGTANGVAYLNGSKVLTTGSALTFDGTNLGVGSASNFVQVTSSAYVRTTNTTNTSGFDIGLLGGASSAIAYIYNRANADMVFGVNNAEQMRLTSTGLGIGTSSPAKKLDVAGTYRAQIDPSNSSLFGSTLTLAGDNGTNQSGARVAAAYESGFGLSFQLSTAGQSGLNSDPSLLTYSTGMRLTSTGLGIGTSSPAVNLQIQKAAADTAIRLSDGTHYWTQTHDTATNGWALSYDGGSALMKLSSTGNLGIGTSSPASKLNVSGGPLYLDNTVTGDYLRFRGSTIGFYGGINSTAAYLGTYTAHPLTLYTNGTLQATLDTSGNLGIGTSSPGEKLTVAGSISTRGGNSVLFYRGDNTRFGSIYADNDGLNIRQPLNDYIIFEKNDGTNLAILDAAGNLGLGVTPSAWGSNFKALQVNDTGASLWSYRSGATSDEHLYLSNNSYNNNTNDIYIRNGAAAQYRQLNGTHAWFNATSGTAGAAITFTQAMTLDASGNVLVGKTSTATSAEGALIGKDAGGCYLTLGYTGTGTVNSVAFFRGTSGSLTQVGSISTTGSVTAYNISSDYRLKEDIAPMTGALAKVQALKPVTYKWKSDGSDGEGFIAHELQAVVPQCVTGEKDAVDAEGKPVYQGIDTSFLVATLTAAIQELKAEVDSLKAALESK